LTNASLVMQDKQTDTYWSLMKGKAVAGELKGNELKELPLGEKTTWKAWREKHPATKVLSVESREDGRNPYESYFRHPRGFQGLKASDDRLDTKAPIYAFRYGGKPWAVPYGAIASGAAFELPDGKQVFLYRAPDDSIFRSTTAFISSEGFERQDGKWKERSSNSTFNGKTRRFESEVEPLSGFDTFWYNWSLNNPSTELLK